MSRTAGHVEQTRKHFLGTVNAKTEADQIGNDQGQSVHCAAECRQVSEPPLPAEPLAAKVGGAQFRQYQERNQPAPDEQSQVDVMPDGNEREYDKGIVGAVLAAAQRDVDVPDYPAVV